MTSDGSVLLHRRDMKAPTSPGLLGIFGGHAEPEDKDSEATARRELSEEISLNIDELKLKHVGEFKYEGVTVNAFMTTVPTEDFEVFEGVGKEKYTMEEALKRDDLTRSARGALEIVSKEK